METGSSDDSPVLRLQDPPEQCCEFTHGNISHVCNTPIRMMKIEITQEEAKVLQVAMRSFYQMVQTNVSDEFTALMKRINGFANL